MKNPRLISAAFLILPLAVLAAPKVIKDVAFLAPGRAEKLDVYLPAPPPAGKLSPAVVWIHGGGWVGGTKNEARAEEICGTLAEAGYVALSIDYKLGDGAWPTNLLDCKNAVRFLRAHAREYYVDPTRIGVAGGSAGGNLALMVAYTSGLRELEPIGPYPGESNAVRCVIDMYGITNALTRQETAKDGTPTGQLRDAESPRVFGGPRATHAAVWRLGSPVTHIKAGSPPTLVLHGHADTTVDYRQSEELVRVLQANGVEHEVVYLDGIGHTFYWQTWEKKPLPRDLRPLALAFLAKHLAPAAAP
jgi:acetyl esterase/lipase